MAQLRLFGKYFQRSGRPKTAHDPRFIRGCQAGAGSWTYAAVPCNATWSMPGGSQPWMRGQRTCGHCAHHIHNSYIHHSRATWGRRRFTSPSPHARQKQPWDLARACILEVPGAAGFSSSSRPHIIQISSASRPGNPQFPFPRFPIWPGIGEGIPDSRFGRERESGFRFGGPGVSWSVREVPKRAVAVTDGCRMAR